MLIPFFLCLFLRWCTSGFQFASPASLGTQSCPGSVELRSTRTPRTSVSFVPPNGKHWQSGYNRSWDPHWQLAFQFGQMPSSPLRRWPTHLLVFFWYFMIFLILNRRFLDFLSCFCRSVRILCSACSACPLYSWAGWVEACSRCTEFCKPKGSKGPY